MKETLPLSQEGRIVLMFDGMLDENALDSYAKYVPVDSLKRHPFLPTAFADAYMISRLSQDRRNQCYVEELEEEQRESWCALPRELKRIVQSSRIHVSLLMNTLGGSDEVMKKFCRMIRWFRDGGSPVDCYITRQAYSAGAEIMECIPANRRHALHTSEVMWHEGRSDRLDFVESDREQHEDRERIMRFLRRATAQSSEGARQKMEAAIERAAIDDRFTLRFTGDELHEFGMLRHLHTGIDELRQAFLDTMHIALGDPKHDPIARFFVQGSDVAQY